MKARVGMDANAAMGIVQRKRLRKLRHAEVDVLWIHERDARRLLPFQEVPGQDGPSGMMTKNVPVAVVDQYIARLNIAVVGGRASVAPNLCARDLPDETRKGVFAAPEVGVLLAGAIGGSEDTYETNVRRKHKGTSRQMPRTTNGQQRGRRHRNTWQMPSTTNVPTDEGHAKKTSSNATRCRTIQPTNEGCQPSQAL